MSVEVGRPRYVRSVNSWWSKSEIWTEKKSRGRREKLHSIRVVSTLRKTKRLEKIGVLHLFFPIYRSFAITFFGNLLVGEKGEITGRGGKEGNC